MTYRVLPAANRDLDEQADYLATNASLETALRFYDAAHSTFEKIAQMPGIGERRDSAQSRLAGNAYIAGRRLCKAPHFLPCRRRRN